MHVPPAGPGRLPDTISHLDAAPGSGSACCAYEVIARWPWELVRIAVRRQGPVRYLFRDARFSLMRTFISHQPVDSPVERPKLTILVADATGVLPDRKLVPDFPAGLPADRGGTARPGPADPGHDRRDDRKVNDGQDSLDIFHFTGHGLAAHDGQAGALVVYPKVDRGARNYRADELAAQLARAGTSLAFINACYTDRPATPDDGPGMAHVLADRSPVVLAMRGDVAGPRPPGSPTFSTTCCSAAAQSMRRSPGPPRGRGVTAGWGSIVLYSRASTGRFLEPVTPVPEPVPEPVPAAARLPLTLDGIRRWAMVGGGRGYWQVSRGTRPGAAAGGLRDGRRHLHLAWYPHRGAEQRCAGSRPGQPGTARPGLGGPHPATTRPVAAVLRAPVSGPQARLLAVAVDYGDQVTCLISTDQATYRIEWRTRGSPDVTAIFDDQRDTRHTGRPIDTVDSGGRLRGRA